MKVRNSNKQHVDINTYFDYIYCLNLDKRRDRWRRVSDELERLGIGANRFSATDGGSKKYISKYNRIIKRFGTKDKKLGYKTIRSPGALGCLVSYRNIINHAKKNNYKKILIFEDDIIFSKNFKEEFSNISKLNYNWKLLYLGSSQHDWSGVKNDMRYFYHAWHSQGTFAFGIDSSIFDEILNVTKDMKIPIDSYLAIGIQKKYKRKCFVFYPNIVIADVTESDIRSDIRNMNGHAKFMKWDLKRYDIKSR